MSSNKFDGLYGKAQQGDRKAMLDVALAFSEGEGVEQSDENFFLWVKKSADAGEPEAAYELAYAYRDGIGIKPDYERFVEWLQEAVEREFPRAMYDVAIWYKEGEGVQTDEKRFFALMKKAAQSGYADAMLELAFAFRDRIGTNHNLNSYISWLTDSAQAGNSEAMFHLAFEYWKLKGKRNRREFFRWLKKAAENEQPNALFHLAIAYRDGEGTKSSPIQYYGWMKRAAEAGIPAGMYHLAISYLKRSKPDKQRFSEWIKRALKAGHPRAFIASGLDDLWTESRISHKDLLELNKALNTLFDTVIKIKRDHLITKRRAKNGVAHFTVFEALNSMLPIKPSPNRVTKRLRLYNFAYMNDPQEGKRLLDDELAEAKPLRAFFTEEAGSDNPISWEEHESSVYIGSFTLKGDDLDMWRTTYGKNGQGYCIVTSLEDFDQRALDEPDILHGGEVVNVTEGMMGANEFLSLTLYAIRYEDKDVKKTLNTLKSRLKKISKKKERIRGNTMALDRTVRLIISQILYLYKNDHYKSEMEARLIGSFDISFEGLKLDLREKPSRVFVESPDFLFKEESQIIIGPTVPKQTIAELDLKYRLARHGINKVDISRSKFTGRYR